MLIKYREKEFIAAPEGVHPATLVDVIDLGEETETYDGKEKTQHKVKLVFQIDKTMPTKDEWSEPRRFCVAKKYTVSLHPKAKLREDLEGWLGRRLTLEEVEAGKNPEDLLGKEAQVQVMHNEGSYNGRPTTWANIVAVLPKAEGTPRLVPDGQYVRVKDRDLQEQSEPRTAGDVTASASTSPEEPEDDDIPF